MPVTQPTQNIVSQRLEAIPPEPVIQPNMPVIHPTQNIAPQAVQPTYYKVDPKAYVEDTYGPGVWALDKRAPDTYNKNRDNINNLLTHNQKNME